MGNVRLNFAFVHTPIMYPICSLYHTYIYHLIFMFYHTHIHKYIGAQISIICILTLLIINLYIYTYRYLQNTGISAKIFKTKNGEYTFCSA